MERTLNITMKVLGVILFIVELKRVVSEPKRN